MDVLDYKRLADKEKVLAFGLTDTKHWLRGMNLARRAFKDTQVANKTKMAKSRAFMKNWLSGKKQD